MFTDPLHSFWKRVAWTLEHLNRLQDTYYVPWLFQRKCFPRAFLVPNGSTSLEESRFKARAGVEIKPALAHLLVDPLHGYQATIPKLVGHMQQQVKLGQETASPFPNSRQLQTLMVINVVHVPGFRRFHQLLTHAVTLVIPLEFHGIPESGRPI